MAGRISGAAMVIIAVLLLCRTTTI